MREPDFSIGDDVKLWCGDCLDLLPQMPDGCVDAVVTDPPYGVGFEGKNTKHTTRRDEGYVAGDNAEIGPVAVRLALAISKRGVVYPGNRRFWDYPPADDIGCVYCPSGAGVGKWGWVCFHPVLYYGPRPSTGLFPTSITSFATVKANGHPCPKPEEWMEWNVGMASLATETILDPFMGSGTTGVAAVRLGRKFWGIELCPEYFDIAVKRIKDAYYGGPLLEQAAKQTEMFKEPSHV